MVMGLAQPPTEISSRNIYFWVKAAGAYGRKPYYLHMPTVLKSGILSLLELSGPVQACREIAINVQSFLPSHSFLFHVFLATKGN